MAKIQSLIICIGVLITAFLPCACDEEEETEYDYYISIDAYRANFTGYYYIDSDYAGSFEGEWDFTDTSGNSHYSYEKGLDDFTSVQIWAFKNDGSGSLTIMLYKNDKLIDSITSDSYSGYNENDTYDLDVGPLYYEE